jgi:hypothetical protein
MSRAVTGPMIAADIRKLRRHRATMATSAALSVGVTALYLTVVLARHDGQLPGARTLGDGTSLMGLYFGSFAAILIGAEAGTVDLTAGVFRDLVATGRPRTALFLTRIPAAIAVALVFTLGGFLLTVGAACAFHGPTQAPGAGLIAESGLWVALATAVVTALAVGVGSLTGSRAVTLTVIIGWQTVASGMLYLATFLGAARDLVLVFAVSRFQPGPAIGTRANPGSTNALNNLKLPMPAVVAIVVILGWLIIPAVAGAWRTRNRDA